MPIRSFASASSANDSVSIVFSLQPELWAQPEELFPMNTVEASASVERCSAKTPRELATPIVKAAVVIEPAAEQPALAALLQMTPTLAARCSGEHSATDESNASMRWTGRGSGSPLNSGFSG